MATIDKLICNLKDEVSKWFYQKGEVDEKVNSKADNSLVTGSSNGLMSSADKIKLDGVATGANKTTVDSAMSSTSVNPVQNKVVKAELDSLNTTKANTNHTHNSLKVETISEGIDFNDYKTEGLYNLPWASVNQSTNRPSNSGGRLEVIVFSNGVRQFFYNYGSDNTGLKVYFRNFDGANDVWMAWHSLADNNNITSLDNNKANVNHTHTQLAGNVSYRQVTDKYENLQFYVSIKNGFCFITWSNPYQSLMNEGITLPEGTYFDVGTVGVPESGKLSVTYMDNDSRVRVTTKGVLQGFIDSVNGGWTYGSLVYPTSSSSLPY